MKPNRPRMDMVAASLGLVLAAILALAIGALAYL